MARRFNQLTKDLLRSLAAKPRHSVSYGKSPYSFPLVNELKKLVGDNDGFHELEQRQKFYQTLHNLKNNRLIIQRQQSDGSFVVELTEKGKRKIKEFQFADLEIPIPKKWDGVWRMLVFDIPNKRKVGREALRNKIKELDFYQLQKSVWVFPYPCEQEIELIVEVFKLYPYVQIIEATKIKNDAKLRRYYRVF